MGKNIHTDIDSFINESANEKVQQIHDITLDNIKKCIEEKGLVLANTEYSLDPWYAPTKIEGDTVWATTHDGDSVELKLDQIEKIVLNKTTSNQMKIEA